MAKINQQIIADHLKISRTTVSRCFTNHKGINPITRAEVFSLAAKLGYRYLQPRSGPKTGPRSHSIGVLICSEAEKFNGTDHKSPSVELLPGLSEFAQLYHWNTEVHFVSPLATSMADPTYFNIEGLRKRLWSGLILMYAFPPNIISELTASFPCVSLVEQYGHVPLDCVDVNHYRGITGLMNRFRRNGHTRIGFFSRKYPVEAGWSYRRFSAYIENLMRLGLSYREKDVIHLDISTPETMAQSYQRVVDQIRDGVTGWICAADHQAYELIIALKERGYEVPRDVSVSGFDGSPRPEGAPQLDTVRIPYYDIGFAGSRRLYDKISKRFDSSQEILMDSRIQEGETIGPCRL